MLADCRIRADEAVRSDLDTTAKRRPGGDETVVVELDLVADDAAATDDGSVADLGKRLNEIAFHDHAVVAEREVRPDRRPRADIACQPVAHRSGGSAFGRA